MQTKTTTPLALIDGKVYMNFIKPFRYVIVHPALMRQIERDWDARA